MLQTVLSGAALGVDAYPIRVEADVQGGFPRYSMVGLPDNAVKEGRDRVYSALRNSGYYYPNKNITLNLAPAGIKKEGAAFDLPIAIGLMAGSEQLITNKLDSFLILGELALDGCLRPVRGGLSIAIMAKDMGYEGVIVPAENAKEFAMVKKLKVFFPQIVCMMR